MEQDKQLKEILFHSAEKPSAGFTDAVMKKINGLSGASLYYRPLVSPGFKKLFVLTMIAVVASIVLLCLIIGLPELHVIDRLQNVQLPGLNYKKTLTFIITFWIVFIINASLRREFPFKDLQNRTE